ncbi:MAG: TenA family protein [Lautropia sp.]|nr:TenA family protein [Lautropia sp.]
MQHFSDALRDECATDWQACLHHRFVHEIFTGSISDAHLRRYLIQDYQFVDRFVALLGAAIASADQYAARVRLSQFAALITSDENTYFLRCFDLLGVAESERHAPALEPVTAAFQALMKAAADSRSYANALAVLCVAEGLYLEWADQPERELPKGFQHAEWIELHANDFFRDFVGWLRSELDRVGSTLDATQQAEARGYFHRAVALERQFFDMVYL